MTNILHDLTGKLDGPTVSLFEDIDRITRSLGIPFFIVGATARDIFLEHIHDIKPKRATKDIDIGILVPDWDHFYNLKETLITTADFEQCKQEHRLRNHVGILLDLVPFGQIAKDNVSISWPPDHVTTMDITGFLECYQTATDIRIDADPEVVIKVVNLAGLAILKLISWDDNPERREKDASDLLLILQNIADTGVEEKLLNNGIDMLEEENYDFEMAAVRFLGKEMSAIASGETKGRLIKILHRGSTSKRGHSIGADALKGEQYDDDTYKKAIDLLNALYRGLNELV